MSREGEKREGRLHCSRFSWTVISIFIRKTGKGKLDSMSNLRSGAGSWADSHLPLQGGCGGTGEELTPTLQVKELRPKVANHVGSGLVATN